MDTSFEKTKLWTLENKKFNINGKVNAAPDQATNFEQFEMHNLESSIKGTLILTYRPHIDANRSRDFERLQYKELEQNENLINNFINLSQRLNIDDCMKGVYCNIRDHLTKQMEKKNFFDCIIVDINMFDYGSKSSDIQGHFPLHPKESSDKNAENKKPDYRGNFPTMSQLRKVAVIIQNIHYACEKYLIGRKEIQVVYNEALMCSRFDLNPFTVKSVIQLEHYVQLCDTILMQLVDEIKQIDPELVEKNMNFVTTEAISSALCLFTSDLKRYLEPEYYNRPGLLYLHGALQFRHGFQYKQSLKAMLFTYSLIKNNAITSYLHRLSEDPEVNLANFPKENMNVAYVQSYQRFFGTRGYVRWLSSLCTAYKDNVGNRFPLPPPVIIAYNEEKLKNYHLYKPSTKPVWNDPIGDSVESVAQVMVTYPLKINAIHVFKPKPETSKNLAQKAKPSGRKRSRNLSTDKDQIEIIELDKEDGPQILEPEKQKSANVEILNICNKILTQTNDLKPLRQDITNLSAQLSKTKIDSNTEELKQESSLLRDKIDKMTSENISTMEKWNSEKLNLYNEIEKLKSENKSLTNVNKTLTEQNIVRLNVSNENDNLSEQLQNLSQIIENIKTMYDIRETSQVINALYNAKKQYEEIISNQSQATINSDSTLTEKLNKIHATNVEITEKLNKSVEETADLKDKLKDAKEFMLVMSTQLPICYPKIDESFIDEPTLHSLRHTWLKNEFTIAQERSNKSLQFTKQIIDFLNTASDNTNNEFKNKSEKERAQIISSAIIQVLKDSIVMENLNNGQDFIEATIAHTNLLTWPTPNQSSAQTNKKKKN